MTGELAHLIEYLQQLDHRLARVESRLVQLMIFLGADPYGKNAAPARRPPASQD